MSHLKVKLNTDKQLNLTLRNSLWIFIYSISGPLMGLVDLAMIGHLGVYHVAALGVSDTVLGLIAVPLMSFLDLSQAAMSKYKFSPPDMRRSIFTFICLASVGIGVILFSVTYFAIDIMADYVDSSGELMDLIAEYNAIAIYELPIMGLVFCFEGYYSAQKNAKVPLIIISIAMVFDVIISYILIFDVFGLPVKGLAGAALSALLAELLTIALFIGFDHRLFRFQKMWRHINKSFLKTYGLMLSALSFSDIVNDIVELFVFRFIGLLGVSAQAFYTAISMIDEVVSEIANSFSTSFSVQMGHAFARGNIKRGLLWVKVCNKLGLFLSAIVTVILLLALFAILLLDSSVFYDVKTGQISQEFIWAAILVILLTPLGVLNEFYMDYFIMTQLSKSVLVLSIIEMVLVIGVSYFVINYFQLGFLAFYIAFGIIEAVMLVIVLKIWRFHIQTAMVK